MYSTSSIVCGLALAGLSLAQSTTISLYVPGADTQPLVASVVGSDSTATTYAVQCAPGTDDSDCGFPGIFTLTEGPSTAAYTLSGDIEADTTSTVLDFTAVINCSLDPSASSAVCTESYGGAEANDPGQATTTYTGTDFSYMPVVVTAGALSSGAAAAPSSASVAPTASSTSGSAASTGSAKTSGTSQTGSASGSATGKSATSASSSSTSTSTGGVPVITGHAGWVIGGVALAAALV